MSKEGYSSEIKREGENKVLLLERLQTYLKDKKSSDAAEALAYSRPSTSYAQDPLPPLIDESSNILRDVLNHKKAELLRQPEVIAFLKSVSSDLKK